MDYKIKLKNSKKHTLIDDTTYEYFINDPWFESVGFLNNLRLHSSGNVVFQKSYTDGRYTSGRKVITIYLHKIIGERFIGKYTKERPFLCAINGRKLDCRVKNLEYRSRSEVARGAKPSSKTGYRGVYQEGRKFRAAIYIDGKTTHIGVYDTPLQASRAYKKRLKQLKKEIAEKCL